MIFSFPFFMGLVVPLCLWSRQAYETSPPLPIFPSKSYPYLNVPLTILPLGTIIGMTGLKSIVLSWPPSLQISAGGWHLVFSSRI
ncbi:hypothetical protein B0H19DRAFT_1167649 [Mycena capillaripes]|nr:hypothetical protein B0H19DRAFT_1167649 [Mycena capillaripes]